MNYRTILLTLTTIMLGSWAASAQPDGSYKFAGTGFTEEDNLWMFPFYDVVGGKFYVYGNSDTHESLSQVSPSGAVDWSYQHPTGQLFHENNNIILSDEISTEFGGVEDSIAFADFDLPGLNITRSAKLMLPAGTYAYWSADFQFAYVDTAIQGFAGVPNVFGAKVSSSGNLEWGWQITFPTPITGGWLDSWSGGISARVTGGNLFSPVNYVAEISETGQVEAAFSWQRAGASLQTFTPIEISPDLGILVGSASVDMSFNTIKARMAAVNKAGEIQWQKEYDDLIFITLVPTGGLGFGFEDTEGLDGFDSELIRRLIEANEDPTDENHIVFTATGVMPGTAIDINNLDELETVTYVGLLDLRDGTMSKVRRFDTKPEDSVSFILMGVRDSEYYFLGYKVDFQEGEIGQLYMVKTDADFAVLDAAQIDITAYSAANIIPIVFPAVFGDGMVHVQLDESSFQYTKLSDALEDACDLLQPLSLTSTEAAIACAAVEAVVVSPINITVEQFDPGITTANYSPTLENFPITVEKGCFVGEAQTYGPIVYDENYDANTGRLLDWVNVAEAPFLWSYSLNRYLYLPSDFITETGTWMWAGCVDGDCMDFSVEPNRNVNTGRFMGWMEQDAVSPEYFWSWILERWLFIPPAFTSGDGSWIYLYADPGS